MTVTLGVIELALGVAALLAGLIVHAQAISRWRAQIEQQVKFLIEEDKRLHGRIESHNTRVLDKLDLIAADLKNVELWCASERGRQAAEHAATDQARSV